MCCMIGLLYLLYQTFLSQEFNTIKAISMFE